MFADVGILGDRVFAALVDGLWQGLAIGALLWMLRPALKRASAATRYAVGFTVLVALALLPLVAGQTGKAPPPPIAANEGRDDDPLSTSLLFAPSPSPIVAAEPELAVASEDRARQTNVVWSAWFGGELRSIVVFVWLVLAAIGLGRLLVSCRALVAIKQRARPFESDADALPTLSGAGRHCALKVSDEVSAPVMLGWFQPAICLPAEWDAWPRSDLQQVLLHERAHLRRWDDFTLIAQRGIETVFFFHPAVRWVGRQLDLDREIACDDHVVASTHEPKSYAACLATLAEGASNPKRELAPGMLFRVEQLPRRIGMLMDAKRDQNPNVSAMLVVAIALLLGGALIFSSEFAPAVAAYQAKHYEHPVSPVEPTSVVATESEPIEEPVEAQRPEPSPSEADRAREAARVTELTVARERAAEEQQLALATEFQELAEAAERQRLEFQQRLERNHHELEQSFRARQMELERELARTRESLVAQHQDGDAIEVERALERTELEFGQRLRELEQAHELQRRRFAEENELQRQHHEQSMAQQNALLHRRMTLAATASRPSLATREPAIPQDELLALMASIAETDSDEEVRRAALRQLAAAQGEPAGRALARLYDGLSDQDTKAQLIRFLAGNRTAPALDKLKDIATSEDDAGLRLQAVEVLGALGRGASGFAPAVLIAPHFAAPVIPPVPTPPAPREPQAPPHR